MRRARFADILQLLATNEVEFIVVGMTAAILQGAPISTIDLDLVHRRTPDNVDRLLRVLADLDAVYRHDPRRLLQRASHLASTGHQPLSTTHADLDCTGAIGDGKSYDGLMPKTIEMHLASGPTIRVLSLAALIETKERTGRPKDLAALPVLRATLDEQKKRT